MDVVWHHTEFDDGDVMPGCDLAQHILTDFLGLLASHHVVAVFRAPFQMVYILAYAMATANQVHKIMSWAGFRAPAPAGAPTQYVVTNS